MLRFVSLHEPINYMKLPGFFKFLLNRLQVQAIRYIFTALFIMYAALLSV